MSKPHLLNSLKKYFGFTEFREGQEEIIEDVMKGRGVLGVLPTGVGKSLCFQLPSMLLPGTTIVISPLISLMVDQVKQLKAKGFKSVVALNSFMEPNEKREVLHSLHKYRLIYLSPEMLQNQWVERALKKLSVDLFVIDEAHCISQWGHEFRTDYLKMYQMIEKLNKPTILALSATATPDVQTDIKFQLNCPHMVDHIYAMDKPNMSFAVETYDHQDDKLNRIKSIVFSKRLPTMIYFSSRQSSELVAEELNLALDQKVAFYHGGMDQTDRLLVQQQFMKDQLDIICCTSAFGMGVDKPNIRRVIHYHFPTQIESFIQEVGRAGRDSKPCASLVLHTPSDHLLPRLLLQKELPDESDVERLFYWLKNNELLLSNEEMEEQLQISESQWNFLKYHLEETNMLMHSSIQTQSDVREIAKSRIISRLRERWNYKNEKFHEIVNWLHCEGCRRRKLYAPFQLGVKSPEVPCCDYCGFSIDDLDGEEEVVKSSDYHQSWDTRLKAIFLQERLNA
ncbi:RecQ family ATP-dependent DNA helicase [Halobacillus seohaensis]|uniref:RecQ family ATP-dependent DNA helicase n=1 Tax=Halobacillus seohaensis TaxID=447421 RepID=A0ABW2EG43_9BACI